jgi:secreted PhoX family phosphatase
VPDDRDGVARLLLPPGFRYRSFGVAGETMADGNVCPGSHDGSALFAMPDGRLRLVRNHEIDAPSTEAAPIASSRTYDRSAGGGTTTLELEQLPDGSVEVVRDFVSLNGTHTNCSGGRTPWDSWLSCEETIEDDRPFVVNEDNDEFQNGFERRHGYVFEVPAAADEAVDPVPLVAMGRFIHEAVAVDPRTGDCYLTEDSDPAGFYRFRPATPGRLADGGVLSALRVSGIAGIDLRGAVGTGTRMRVEWVPIEDPDPDPGVSYEDAAQGVFRQAAAQGAATFTGLEGCVWNPAGGRHGAAVFLSTAGGGAGSGQVWAYHRDPSDDGGVLEVVFESPGPVVLNYPDAVTPDPAGALIIADDGIGTSLLRRLGRDGDPEPIVAAADGRNDPTGPTFSPDGRTLFFNLMGEDAPLDPAMTFAVWGPWPHLRST